MRSLVQAKRSQVKDTLLKKLEKKEINRKAALRMIAKLEVDSAVASGAAIHAMLYSTGSAESSLKLIAKLLNGPDRA